MDSSGTKIIWLGEQDRLAQLSDAFRYIHADILPVASMDSIPYEAVSSGVALAIIDQSWIESNPTTANAILNIMKENDVPVIMVGAQCEGTTRENNKLIETLPVDAQLLGLRAAAYLKIYKQGNALQKQEHHIVEYQQELDRLREQNQNLINLSLEDGLTGIANRRCIDRYLDMQWKACSRHGELISLIMVDMDFFKSYNDLYGHVAGDRALIEATYAMDSVLGRAEDMLGRFGGEEFMAVLPDTGLEGGAAVAERMRLAVSRLAFPHEAGVEQHLTISLGVGCAYPGNGGAPQSLIEAADTALYSAKSEGRNTVMLFTKIV